MNYQFHYLLVHQAMQLMVHQEKEEKEGVQCEKKEKGSDV